MRLEQKLAKNLKRRRGDLGQTAFAKKLGISQSTLARLEAADQNTTLKTLKVLMKSLNCKLEDLFRDS